MNLCDAHCHLANLSQAMPLEALFADAAQRGITRYLSSALSRRDLELYPVIAENKLIKLLYSAGVHPSFDYCDLKVDDIQKLCNENKIWAVGEIGLDRANKDFNTMKQLFMDQLELASNFNLPVVLHIVGYQQEAYNILRKYPLKYLLHGYAGSVEAFHSFTKLNCFYTISERVLHKDKRSLLDAMLKHRRFLFETDITAYYVKDGEKNPLLRLLEVLNCTQEISNIDLNTLLKIQADNYLLLTGQHL